MKLRVIDILKSRTSESETAIDGIFVLNVQKGWEETIEEEFEMCLRKKVVPPIKGEITLGKIRWRGIRRIIIPGLGITYLEQRNKMVSKTFDTTPMGSTGTYRGL